MGFCMTSICTTTRSPTSSNKSQQSNSINLIYLLKFVSKLFALDKNRPEASTHSLKMMTMMTNKNDKFTLILGQYTRLSVQNGSTEMLKTTEN